MLKIHNSLTRKIEGFKPVKQGEAGVYVCGPTVYDYVSIGNWRTYLLGDILVRILRYFGFQVKYMMNITDVGHLTGDNFGDPDQGDDRMEKAASREKKTAWQIAHFYSQDFFKGYRLLNLTRPEKFVKATEHIREQIELVRRIEKRGFTYQISDGIYFDIRAWEKAGHQYGQLSTLDKIRTGVRVKDNPEKKDPRDFALWKFSPKKGTRQMEWDSPWGRGFPGWHIECSAMSMKYLGDQFDFHLGGEDLRSTHHPNEIAQSEAATGKEPFVKYWLHGAFLKVDGRRMGKSLGNVYTLHDLEAKGFEPLALRYFYLTGHYRKPLNFTWKALKSSQKALAKLRSYCQATIVGQQLDRGEAEEKKKFQKKIEKAIANDLNMPEALAVVWEMVKSDLSNRVKWELLKDWDRVLGLNLRARREEQREKRKIEDIKDQELKKLLLKREELRKKKQWAEADKIRRKVEKEHPGLKVIDKAKGVVVEFSQF